MTVVVELTDAAALAAARARVVEAGARRRRRRLQPRPRRHRARRASTAAGGAPVRVGAAPARGARGRRCAPRARPAGSSTRPSGAALALAGYDRDVRADAPARRPRLRARRVAGWRAGRGRPRDRGTVRVPRGVRLDLGATGKALDRRPRRRGGARRAGARACSSASAATSPTAGAAPAGGWLVRVADDHARRPPAASCVRLRTRRRWRPRARPSGAGRAAAPPHRRPARRAARRAGRGARVGRRRDVRRRQRRQHRRDRARRAARRRGWRAPGLPGAARRPRRRDAARSPAGREEAWPHDRVATGTPGALVPDPRHRRGDARAADAERRARASSRCERWRAGGRAAVRGRGAAPRPSRCSSLALLAVHVLTAVLDSFAPIRLLDAVVPFARRYRPLWLGLGALALDGLLAVIVTSLVRRRLGLRAWRARALGSPTRAGRSRWCTGSAPAPTRSAPWMLALTRRLRRGRAGRGGVARWLARRPAHAARARPAAGAAAAPLGSRSRLAARSGPLAPGWARRSGTPARLLASRAAPRAPARPGRAPVAAPRPLAAGVHRRRCAARCARASAAAARRSSTCGCTGAAARRSRIRTRAAGPPPAAALEHGRAAR